MAYRFFVYSSTILVHLLLVLAVVAILLRVAKEKKALTARTCSVNHLKFNFN